MERDFLTRQLGIGDQLVEPAHQLADIARDGSCEEIEHVAGHLERRETCQLGGENFLPEFDVGRLDIGDQTHRETAQQARFDAIECLRCTVCREDQTLAFGQQRIDRIKQLFLRRSLADDELDVVDQQQVEAAQAGFEFEHLVGFERLDEFDHEPLGAAVENAAARMGLQKAVADRVEQMRLALAGRGLEIERRELRLFRCAHALCRVEREHIGLAGDKGGEGQARVETDRAGETGVAQRVRTDCHHRRVGPVIGRTAAIGMQPQIGDLAAARMHLDTHVAHFAAGNLPCQAQPVGKAILDPVGAEFGGQEQVERARVLIDAANLDRPDPLAVQLVAKILAEPLADIGPIRSQVYRFLIFHEIVL